MKLLYHFIIVLFFLIPLYAENHTFLNDEENAYIAQHNMIDVYVEPNISFYSHANKNGLNGYAVEHIKLLAKKLHINVNFITHVQREDIREKLTTNTLSIALLPTFKDANNNSLHLSKLPIGILKPALFVPTFYQQHPDIESIEKFKIAIAQEDAFLPIIKQYYPDSTIEVVDNSSEAITKVINQEVDIAVGLHEIFIFNIKQHELSSFESIPIQNNTNFLVIPLSLATAKENTLLMTIFDKAMDALDNEELFSLKSKFFMPDTLRQTHITVPLSQEEKFFLMKKQFLNVCTIPQNLPYSDISNDKYKGIAADINVILEKSLDTPIQLIYTKTREESLEKLLNKECDFMSFETKKVHSDERISFTSSLLNVPLVVVTTNDLLYVNDFKTISDHSFAIVKNQPMIPLLKKTFPDIILKEVRSEVDGLKLVEDDEHYGFITSHFAISNLFQNHVADNLNISAQIPLEMPFSFAVLKENALLLSILEKSTTSVLEPQIASLVKKWVPSHYPKGFDYTIVLQLVLVFVIFSAITFSQHFEVTLQNLRLEEAKKSLATLNQELEMLVKKEVAVNREKDMLMYRQSRFASMGEMIGNIAHQWRQPLMELSALLMELHASIHFKKDVSKEDVITTVQSSNNVIQYMSHTIDDFRNFFSTRNEPSEFCINDVINDALKIMSATLQHHKINVIVNAQTKNAMAHGLRNEYAQVIINILSNAKDMFIVRNIKYSNIVITINENDEYSKVSVVDNAGGIDEENFSKIFEPFFTKKKTNGTGIGLFMSRMIIENHMKGIITASNVEDGASFFITVPKKLATSN